MEPITTVIFSAFILGLFYGVWLGIRAAGGKNGRPRQPMNKRGGQGDRPSRGNLMQVLFLEPSSPHYHRMQAAYSPTMQQTAPVDELCKLGASQRTQQQYVESYTRYRPNKSIN